MKNITSTKKRSQSTNRQSYHCIGNPWVVNGLYADVQGQCGQAGGFGEGQAQAVPSSVDTGGAPERHNGLKKRERVDCAVALKTSKLAEKPWCM